MVRIFISFLLGCINGSDDVFKRFILAYIYEQIVQSFINIRLGP